MVSLVNSHTNATSQKWYLWAIDLRFALDSTSRWICFFLRTFKTKQALSEELLAAGAPGLYFFTLNLERSVTEIVARLPAFARGTSQPIGVPRS